MISLQIISRNIMRISTSRGFGSASVLTTKSNASAKEATTKRNDPKVKAILKDVKDSNDVKMIDLLDVNKKSSTEPNKSPKNSTNELSERIAKLDKVSDLLELSEKNFNQKIAMSVLSRLSLLTASNKLKSDEFENDIRFIKICRLLAKIPLPQQENKIRSIQDMKKSAELETILNVACDDEAIQLIKSLPLTQKIRVLSSLAKKKARSPAVLKSLSQSIALTKGEFNLKESSDILYALTILNYNDDQLLQRTSSDICREIVQNQDKMAVVGSIITSLGYLKYKNPQLLDTLSKWMVKKMELSRPRDLISFMVTLALVNYRPTNLKDIEVKILPKITAENVSTSEWLDFVWALSVLELHQTKYLESVLRPEFEALLSVQNKISPAQKMKMLNINAVAKYLTENYNGPIIPLESDLNNIQFGYRKSKQILLDGLLDTLKSLFTNQSYIRTESDTKMGFVIDAECVLNEKRLPQPLDSDNKNAFRIAFVIMDFHDICKGDQQPNGFNVIAIKLLKSAGYKVLEIPHHEFSTSDKLIKRVQYLDSKLKGIVQTK